MRAHIRFANGIVRDLGIPLNGTYPEYREWRHLLRLVDEQVLEMVNENDLLQEYIGEKRTPFWHDLTIQDMHIIERLFLNKGYVLLEPDGDLALYRHDFSWWLLLKERNDD